MATTSITNALSGGIARLVELGLEESPEFISLKVRQFRLVNIALVFLYVSAIFLAVSGLLAGLGFNLMLDMKLLIEVFVCISIGAVVVAMCALMIYSMRAFRIKEKQFRQM